MDKIKIFVSYFSGDDPKLKIVKEILKGEERIKPIIIADKREPKKLLTEKVIEGIKQADYIIPILTERSISTQWINQEIGYSKALAKNLIPIVELEIIDDLKGFIHKQIDLPYSYNRNSHKASENKSFKKAFEKLIIDLNSFIPKELDFREKALIKNEEEKFQSKRRNFREYGNDPKAIEVADLNIKELFDNIQKEVKQFVQEGILFSQVNRQKYGGRIFILEYKNNSIKLDWNVPYVDSLMDSNLIITKYRGVYSLETDPYWTNEKHKPKMQEVTKYIFDIDRNENYCWTEYESAKQIELSNLINECFEWLIEKSGSNNN